MDSRFTRRRRIRFLLEWPLLSVIAVATAYAGVKLRWHCYHDSEPFRFKGDIGNGWNQGTGIYKDADVLRYARLNGGTTTRPSLRNVVGFGDYFAALRKRYDVLFAQSIKNDYGLDYPPARLLIMSSWVWYRRAHVVGRPPPSFDMQLAAPLLRLNTILEGLSALAVFLIIRRVLRRDGSRFAATAGLIGAVLAWFSPAALLDGHVWPQWDNWPLPFYLFACWFALRNKWLVSGTLLALGAMCKGQLLIAAPPLLLWPLLSLRFRAAGDLLLGFFAAALAFVSPWLLNNAEAMSIFLRLGVVAALITLPWRRVSLRLTLFAVAYTLLIVGLCFGSTAWYLIGFAYGARHFPFALHIGTIPNLGSILNDAFDFNASDTLRLSATLQLTTRGLLITLYLIATIVCGASLALQARRNDRRILIALALPWLTAVSLLPQMHERYLLWAGVCTALLAGVSPGLMLIHVLIALVAALPIATAILDQSDRGRLSPAALATVDQWRTALHQAWPGDAWTLLTLVLILVYLALTRSPARLTYATPVQRSDTKESP